MLAGGRGVLGVYYLLEDIIHYYYCQFKGGDGLLSTLEDCLVRILVDCLVH